MDWVAQTRVASGLTTATIHMVMMQLQTPLDFWLELGSYQGNSAVLTARELKRLSGNSTGEILPKREFTVVCVDPFTGYMPLDDDARGDDGLPRILNQFATRVLIEGHDDVVIPFPGTASSVLMSFYVLARRGALIHRPQVIFIDSSHEYADTLVELER
eukprot:TRINITY_DN20314_c0_g1_i3.p1 TRINITY_DN20314_c0_g1~~TRINITY_DN20314_c0_g1_i3.p1  ORF type:complete len:159 (-),score=17.24 TRINITY_DN20314_c0_g1_i3:426-902(-)